MTPQRAYREALAEVEKANAECVAAVKKDDDEVAHIQEDLARATALKWIAAHATDDRARKLAELALATDDLDFHRWCA